MEVWPGAMEGVMSPEFVQAANSLALVPRWITPFLRISQVVPRPKLLSRFAAPFLAGKVPVTIQLMGVDVSPMCGAAEFFAANGAAGIDLNCACPSRQVISGGAGGGALRDPTRLVNLAAGLKRVLPHTPFSVKLRAGFQSPDELDQLIPRLADVGVDRFFVHFRTVREQYLPVPGRVERLQHAVKLAAGVPVIAGGDVASIIEAESLIAATGAAGVFAARGWLRDPWLLRRIEGAAGGIPDVETGREKVFSAASAAGVTGGRGI
ncbi:MAG: tRNA-dihydrouridine synthase family protein [Victivallaceae bacterium]|nr:tRNA-dihydrouridine synthase family protein [Victivallaceae bacterium]